MTSVPPKPPVDSSDANSSRGPVSNWFLAGLYGFDRAINARALSPTSRRPMLLIALSLFVVVTAVSFGTLPDAADPNWWLLPAMLLVINPLMLLANAAEYRAMARINSQRVGWAESFRLTLLATAASLLPIPGGVVIRTQALRAAGSTFARALGANAAAGLAWLGTGLLVISLLFASSGHQLEALALGTSGALFLAMAWSVLRRIHGHEWFLSLLGVELATVAVSGLRIYLAFQLIGMSATPAQAIALTSSIIVAAAIGFFPAGLGLRELLAGLVGIATGLTAPEAVAATATDRVSGLVTAGVLTALLLLGPHIRRRGNLKFD